MGIVNHVPDPTQGAIVDAANQISLPDDNENMKADNIRLGDEQLADWVAFLMKGPLNDIDFKITGNGTPPLAGYTPTVRAIEIKGTLGLFVSGNLTTRRVVRSETVQVTAVNQTLGVADGARFRLDNPGAFTWTIGLQVTGAVAGDFMRFFLPSGNAAGGYVFRNSDTLVEVCGMSGTHPSIAGSVPTFSEVEFNGTQWEWTNGCIGTVVLP